ncbi:MAG TPA: glycerol-3-phosphate dehydrogenase/oxidase [Saprospiraceae bacterium]|nr:glycerol-3-phosphate dehydrogenase/oxidase [Saprospiraceae bacterium]HMQ82665.1 glycerol-3-phosphate dehydrogenase/oxidase [Saprospiraceae bacterium]
MNLSALKRTETIAQLSTTPFDLVVIGGGITGAGIALDAVSRGLKTALIDMKDFASGTSSKSTKLIHGGLRYLKQLEISLVREVGRERAIVHRLAPHLVSPEKMLLPLIKDGTYGVWSTSLGLWVYDALAGVHGADKRQILDKEETLKKEPLLQSRADILTGSGFYAEYRTDDARLTIENIKTAAQRGAICLNYIKASNFIYENDEITGIHCEDIFSGQTFALRSRLVVNAAGPWVDELRSKDQVLEGKRVFHSKGVHIVVPRSKFPVRQAVYFDVADGRMIFAIPRQRVTYIGTTDTPYEGNLSQIPILKSDVQYLLNAVNAMFPQLALQLEDVESAWAGLRPLIYESGKSASEMSRKDEIFESDRGLISIAGGKLTGYRKMAERICTRAVEKLGKGATHSSTDQIELVGGPFANAKEVKAYVLQLSNRLNHFNFPEQTAEYLVANYGRQSDIILDKMPVFQTDPKIALARAEAWFCIHYELATTLLDFFNRRTGRLFFNLPGILAVLQPVAADFKQYLAWDSTRHQQEIRDLEACIRNISHFEEEA